jgi:hypothetical protein
MVRKAQSFNWTGIQDNNDGTYSADGTREKKRLLKALHDQGYSVRSKRNSDGSWTVTPIGSIRPPKRSAVSSQQGKRTRSRYAGYSGAPRRSPARRYGSMPGSMGATRRPMPQSGTPGPMPKPRSKPVIPEGTFTPPKAPLPQSKKERFFTEGGQPKLPGFLQKRTDKEKEFNKSLEESNKSLEQERIREERAQTTRDLEKQEYQRNKMQFERHEQAEGMRSRMNQPRVSNWQSGSPAASQSPPAQSAPQQKIDSTQLQAARQNQVSSQKEEE